LRRRFQEFLDFSRVLRIKCNVDQINCFTFERQTANAEQKKMEDALLQVQAPLGTIREDTDESSPEDERQEWVQCVSSSGLRVEHPDVAPEDTPPPSTDGYESASSSSLAVSADTYATQTPSPAHSQVSSSSTAFGRALNRRVLYEESVQKFFSEPERLERLRKLALTNYKRMPDLIHYFTVRYGKGSVTTSTGIWCPSKAYTIAITKFSKAFFDLNEKITANTRLVRVGDGDTTRDVNLPLSRLIAFKWFIEMGFDDVLLGDFDNFRKMYEKDATSRKQVYSKTFRKRFQMRKNTAMNNIRKKKLQKLRETQNRAASSSSVINGELVDAPTQEEINAVQLTREDMEQVKAEMQQEKERERKEKREAKKRQEARPGGGRKRKRGKKDAALPPILVQNGVSVKPT
jgi:hypothetical protein